MNTPLIMTPSKKLSAFAKPDQANKPDSARNLPPNQLGAFLNTIDNNLRDAKKRSLLSHSLRGDNDSFNSSHLKKSSLALPEVTNERRGSKKFPELSRSLDKKAVNEQESGIVAGSMAKKSLQDSMLLLVPKEVITQRSVKNFTSFRNIITLERAKDKNFDSELTELRTYRNLINTQLAFNKMNEKVYEANINELEADSYRKVFNTLRTTKYLERMMPPVRKYPSRSLNHSIMPDEIKPTAIEPKQTTVQKKGQQYFGMRPLDKKEFAVFVYRAPEALRARPEVREGATFVAFGGNGYLYGGVSKWLINDVHVLDSSKWTWDKCETVGEVPNEGRLGHTACVYQRSIVVFGGEKQFNHVLKIRECLNDLKTFSLDSLEWKKLKAFGDFVEPRRNHIAAVIGKNLLIHGGMNSIGDYLSDMMTFNFATGIWSACPVPDDEQIGLAFHTACLILHKDHHDVQLYKGIEAPIHDKSFVIKEEGLYVFGGKNEFGDVMNTLRVLKIGQKPLKWITPETKGQPPAPRFQHVFVHFPRLNALIVHGGRNDRANLSAGEQGILADISLLYLDSLEWVTVAMYGAAKNPRFAHCVGVFGTKLAIFGGMNFTCYMDSGIEIVEFDERIVTELRKSENAEKKMGPESILQLSSGVDAMLLSKGKTQTSSEKVLHPNINGKTYLPVPRKDELKLALKDAQCEEDQNGEASSPKKNLMHEAIRSSFRKATLARTMVKVRTLAPITLDSSPSNIMDIRDVLKAKIHAENK